MCLLLQKQAEVNTGLLLLGSLCHALPLMLRYSVSSDEQGAVAVPTLMLSRVCSIVMLIAYVAYLFFQLKTHRRLFEAQEVLVFVLVLTICHCLHFLLSSSHVLLFCCVFHKSFL